MESWQDFLKRTTRWTEEQLKAAGQKEWLATWRTRQWAWAGKLFTKDETKWSAIATRWQPLLHTRSQKGRQQGRPRKRWDQDIENYLKSKYPDKDDDWKVQANYEKQWQEDSDHFVSTMCSNI